MTSGRGPGGAACRNRTDLLTTRSARFPMRIRCFVPRVVPRISTTRARLTPGRPTRCTGRRPS